MPPSLNHKTQKPYSWGKLGLVRAEELPVITEDTLAAVLARYRRKPTPIKAQQEAKREDGADLPDIEILQLPEDQAKEGWRMVGTLIAAMEITGSAKLAARNRNGFIWELDIASTRQWQWLLGAFVDWFGSPEAAEPFLDKLSKGDFLPKAERARVREAYNRFGNWRKLKGIVTAEQFQHQAGRRARSVKTLNALRRAAAAIVNQHKLGEARKAAHAIAAGKLSMDALAEATAHAIEAKTRSGKARELALLLLEGVVANGGEHRIGPDERTQLREQLCVGANDLAQLLGRLVERSLFVIKGGSGGRRVTTVGLNPELVIEPQQPDFSQPDADIVALTKLEALRARFNPDVAAPVLAAIQEGFGTDKVAVAALAILERIVRARGYCPLHTDFFAMVGSGIGMSTDEVYKTFFACHTRGLIRAKKIGDAGYLMLGVAKSAEQRAAEAAQNAAEEAIYRAEQKADQERAEEAIAALAKASRVADLPLILVEFDDLVPREIVEVLQEPDFDRRTRYYVAKQTKGLAAELSYLVRRAQEPGTLRLLGWEKCDNELEEEDGGVTTATVAGRIFFEARYGFRGYMEWWTEKCAKDGKPTHLPPSKLIGIYRNRLAVVMKALNMGTRRHLTATFWQRVKRGEQAVGKRRRADIAHAAS